MTPDTFKQRFQQGVASLDAQLNRVQTELNALSAGRPADPDRIAAAVTRAQQAADAVGSAVAEAAAAVNDPPPVWETRKELEEIFTRLEQRLRMLRSSSQRKRLAAIAESLSIAQVVHPKWRKVVPALEALRTQAANQVQELAAKELPPELPGPEDGNAWLAWAWDLTTDQVEETLAVVRSVAPALAEVVLEIDPSQWVVVADGVVVAEPVSSRIVKLESAKPESSKTAAPAPAPSAAPEPVESNPPPQAEEVVEAEPVSGVLARTVEEPTVDLGTNLKSVMPSESWIGSGSSVSMPPEALPASDEESSVIPTRPRLPPKPPKPPKNDDIRIVHRKP
jgi:hypothetical protein